MALLVTIGNICILGNFSLGIWGELRELSVILSRFRSSDQDFLPKIVDAMNSCLKPIFHCDAKPFALGPGVGLSPQRHSFALGIPTC